MEVGIFLLKLLALYFLNPALPARLPKYRSDFWQFASMLAKIYGSAPPPAVFAFSAQSSGATRRGLHAFLAGPKILWK